MRKADYAALAAIIKKRMVLAETRASRATCTEGRASAGGQAESCIDIARDFVDVASVNRAEFLKACGLSP